MGEQILWGRQSNNSVFSQRRRALPAACLGWLLPHVSVMMRAQGLDAWFQHWRDVFHRAKTYKPHQETQWRGLPDCIIKHANDYDQDAQDGSAGAAYTHCKS